VLAISTRVARPQAAGVGQNFAGDSDVVVPCKVLDHFEGGVVERRQALAEFGFRPAFNAGDQNTKHIVEDLDLIFAEAVAFMQEKIRHLPEGANPLLSDEPFLTASSSSAIMEYCCKICPMSLLLRPTRTEPGSGKVEKVAGIQA